MVHSHIPSFIHSIIHPTNKSLLRASSVPGTGGTKQQAKETGTPAQMGGSLVERGYYSSTCLISTSLHPATRSRKQRVLTQAVTAACPSATFLLRLLFIHREKLRRTEGTQPSQGHPASLWERIHSLRSLGLPEGGCQPVITTSPSPGIPGCSHPRFTTLRSPSAASRPRGPGPQETARPARPGRRQIDGACAALTLHLIRPSFSSPGFLAAFKLSHKIYLLFHEYISSRQAQAFYIFTLYIFHGRLIAVSKAERGRGREREQTEPAAGGGGRGAEGGTQRAGRDGGALVPTATPATLG